MGERESHGERPREMAKQERNLPGSAEPKQREREGPESKEKNSEWESERKHLWEKDDGSCGGFDTDPISHAFGERPPSHSEKCGNAVLRAKGAAGDLSSSQREVPIRCCGAFPGKEQKNSKEKRTKTLGEIDSENARKRETL